MSKLGEGPSESLIKLSGVIKSFPGVRALDGVTVAFESGSVHALVGENGAGKSTLGKIMAGIYRPDEGTIALDGESVSFGGPRDAVSRGISIVHQELLFCENMTVAENMCLEDLPSKGIFVDSSEMERRASSWLGAIGAEIEPGTRLGDLPVSKQQLVQIAGAIGRGARVLIFDEPTSSLSQLEGRRLLGLIKDLRAKGVCCIYVSHRLEEVFEVANTITVLRDGRLVATLPADELTPAALVPLMIGRELTGDAAPAQEPREAILLKVEGLSVPGAVREVSLEIKEGEMVGLAGLVGAGRTEIAEAIFGLAPRSSGVVRVSGRMLGGGPHDALKAGLGLVPEDRKRHGLVLAMTVGQNITMTILDRIAALGWIRPGRERSVATQLMSRMDVRAAGPNVEAATLSGGNQQKIVISKWLAADCKVLIVDEPTRGVDVAGKAEIHRLLRELAASGKGILVVSSELPELLALCGRILVVRNGQIVAELTSREAREDVLMRHMAGV